MLSILLESASLAILVFFCTAYLLHTSIMYASRKLANVTTEFSKTVWLKDATISLFFPPSEKRFEVRRAAIVFPFIDAIISLFFAFSKKRVEVRRRSLSFLVWVERWFIHLWLGQKLRIVIDSLDECRRRTAPDRESPALDKTRFSVQQQNAPNTAKNDWLPRVPNCTAESHR